jgi:hypothetical protein
VKPHFRSARPADLGNLDLPFGWAPVEYGAIISTMEQLDDDGEDGMAQRGRISAAALGTPQYGGLPPRRDLAPPESLSPEAREIFVDLVASCPPDHFEAADLGLISAYATAQAMSERAAIELQGDGPPDSKWMAAWEKGVRAMSALALRLRLAPQSRRERASPTKPLSWVEQFAADQRR